MDDKIKTLMDFSTALFAMCVDKGVFTIEEFRALHCRVQAETDQLVAKNREEYYQANPGARMMARLLGEEV